jgi:Fe2+ transport system protein B
LLKSDTDTTRTALQQLEHSDTVLLVVQAPYIDDDLADLLPLAKDKQGAVAVTFWDKVRETDAAVRGLDKLSKASGLSFIPLDARNLSPDDRSSLRAALENPRPIIHKQLQVRAGWHFEPRPTILEHRYLGPLVAALLLLFPAVAAVWGANAIATLIETFVRSFTDPLAGRLAALASPLKDILVGRYGFVTMGPLLLVWAVPTVVIYTLLLGAYKASGLMDRITVALHPLTQRIGLSGRDVVRVIMGFGCNVPAVISTRACSSCSRGTCISAIAFGAACSYQLGASIGVFNAAHLPWLVVPYITFLTVTTLIYTRLTAPPVARSPLNLLLVERRAFLEWPRWTRIWGEARGSVVQFFRKALPIFFLITLVASLLDWVGVLNALADILGPTLAIFNLPTQAALPLILASIRKDGILLFAERDTVYGMTPGEILTGVYLASVLLPCLVTTITIMREQSSRFTLKLIGRQAVAAVAFTCCLAWTCALFGW